MIGTERSLKEIHTKPLVMDFSLQGAEQLTAAMEHNLRVVVGGEVVMQDGSRVRTSGYLGGLAEDLQQDITSLQGVVAGDRRYLETSENRFKGRWEVFGWVIRRSPLERDVDTQKKSLLKEQGDELKPALIGRETKRREIDRLCKDYRVDLGLKEKFNHLVVIEQFLDENPGTEDLGPIMEHITALGDMGIHPTPDILRTLLFTIKTIRPEFREYKELLIGRQEGNFKEKGLRDYLLEIKSIEEKYEPILQRADREIQQVQQAIKERADRKLRIKTAENQIQSLYGQLRSMIDVGVYLGRDYLPKAEEIVDIGRQITQAQEDLLVFQESEHLLDIEERALQGTRRASTVRQNRLFAKTRLQDRIMSLNQRLQVLVQPDRRIAGPKAPDNLRQALRRMQADGFDIQQVPDDKKSFIKMIMILSGQQDRVLVR